MVNMWYDDDSEYDSDSESDYSEYDDDEDPYWELNDQGIYGPKKEDPLFIKRMIELEQDAQMEIAKLKPLIPNSTEKEDAISLLETFSVNNRYFDREKKEDKTNILIEKLWFEGNISSYEDEIVRTYSRLQNIFRTTTAMWGDFTETPETQYSESSKQKDDDDPGVITSEDSTNVTTGVVDAEPVLQEEHDANVIASDIVSAEMQEVENILAINTDDTAEENREIVVNTQSLEVDVIAKLGEASAFMKDVLGSSRNTPAPDEDTIVKIQALSAGSLNSSTIIVSNTTESLLDSKQSKAETLESQGNIPRKKDEVGRLRMGSDTFNPQDDEKGP